MIIFCPHLHTWHGLMFGSKCAFFFSSLLDSLLMSQYKWLYLVRACRVSSRYIYFFSTIFFRLWAHCRVFHMMHKKRHCNVDLKHCGTATWSNAAGFKYSSPLFRPLRSTADIILSSYSHFQKIFKDHIGVNKSLDFKHNPTSLLILIS